MTDPVFVLCTAIGEALTDLQGIGRMSMDDPEYRERLVSVVRRLRAAEEIGLDVQVMTAPVEGQEVLFDG